METTEELRKLRVAVAEEVIAGIENKTIEVSTDWYIALQRQEDADALNLDTLVYAGAGAAAGAQELSQINGYPCVSCALGSIAVAAVRRGIVENGETLLQVMGRLFSNEQLIMIEAIYMGPGFSSFLVRGGWGVLDENEQAQVDAWWDRYGLIDRGGYEQDLQRKAAYRAVLDNIIRNEGEFKIEDVQ